MKILLIVLFTAIGFAKSINVAVSANVNYAMQDLIKQFNQTHPNTKVQTTIGSSGKLSAQIRHGAPYDIFISANMAYPKALYKEGLCQSKPKIYAKGTLAIFTTKEIDLKGGLSALANPKIDKIAIANDKTAPYGVATKEALTNAKLYSKLKPKFIYGESIGQTLIYTLKATDIGVVATSLLHSPKMAKYQKGKNWIEINKTLYTPTQQGATLIKNAPKEAEEFYNFLFSKEAKEVFSRYGYLVD